MRNVFMQLFLVRRLFKLSYPRWTATVSHLEKTKNTISRVPDELKEPNLSFFS